jgi:hypothetical protein
VQLTGLEPTQDPLWHVSVCVQALLSSHFVPSVPGAVPHFPAEQVFVLHCPAPLQTSPHCPQFAVSDVRFTSQPLAAFLSQSAKPVSHVRVQASFAPQVPVACGADGQPFSQGVSVGVGISHAAAENRTIPQSAPSSAWRRIPTLLPCYGVTAMK